ncbi:MULTISPECIES: pyruvate, phosphate dikinase [unclassified Bradyrhizobium]|uniref:pyruvate, phosphate dikinase n=1 Tax=unclassified Bradyrhizobium TaxID=2631580 RepID=UPI001FF80761|nr:MULTISPECIES: pyruvate, phosphate dikinase [unclassified Bradyrhizobium]MCK1303945.1 pyruvate, phosphate dikinase [Bradyrhizobium sp. 37]MCK1775086.1 pyruvate, phosphate dikinase [Bradyrhizobium sp. 134]
MAKAASKTPAKMPAKSKSSAKAKAAPAARKALAKRAPKPVAKAAVKPLAKPAVKPAAKSVSKSVSKAVAKAPTKPVAPKVAVKPVPSKAASSKAVPVAAKAGKWVFTFGDGKAEGKAEMRDLLGGKGANLAEMANLGLPVPPGFTIPTSVCTYFYAHDKSYPKELRSQVEKALDHVGKLTGKIFGDSRNPLLVSVRSGGRASMPGMMDTVLNLGLNDETVEALSELSGDRRFAYDSYRRFITMYSDVVLGFEHHHFEEILDTFKDSQGYTLDTDLTADDWVDLVGKYKDAVARETGKDFPQDPHDQLWGAIGAVFSSWMNARAVTYRRLHDIPESWGTAVNVQAMVFGNMGETSATGVAFTRNPSTGESKLYGEFLINAQGEDVVAGIRTPQDITEEARKDSGSDKASMESAMPEAFKELTRIYTLLEKHYRDMQDMEFTVEQGKLWMLQTRGGKRTAKAALRIAVELANEGLITKKEAVTRIDPASLDQLLHPTIDPNAKRDVIATGLPASPGAASGEIVFSSDEAAKLQADGRKVILVRIETSPEDIHGMHAAEGILTTRGGMTSHAAVVARGMGKPCVSGCGTIRVDYGRGTMSIGSRTFKTGDVITIDGSLGQVLAGRMPMIEPELSGEFGTLMKWADQVRKIGVRVNADTPEDAHTAIKFGAEGIGLCRTEHMFFEETRIRTVREMILSEDEQSRRAALAKLLPMQRADFVELFEIMKGLPVTIRLLDPPLHEFLPHTHAEVEEVARAMNTDPRRLADRARELSEFNPMLGFRGCRIAIAYPEIAEMQARAIFEAAVEAEKRTGKAVGLEVMVPLIATKMELDLVKARIDSTAKAVMRDTNTRLTYQVGTMIELPRACLLAAEIAESAEFFSFGTNDLTQTTYGISRDDAASFLGTYVSKGILPIDPFVALDQEGVGELVKIGVARGRKTRASLKVGICGEHGGDPASVAFCHAIGLDYVSCSPYRVPIARLAAAQAALGKAVASQA